MKVRRVIAHARTVVFRFTIEEISGFLAKLLYVLLRTSADVAVRPWRAPLSRAAGPGPFCAQEYGKDHARYRGGFAAPQLNA